VLFNESDFSKVEKVIRHNSDFCKVSFEFRVDGIIYTVVRKRSKKGDTDLRLSRGEEDITGRRPSDTEKELFKLIKMNCKTFCNSVLFSQAEMLNGLAALTPSARKLIMKDAMQLGVYSTFEKLAKKKASDITNDITKEKIIISTIGNPIDDIKKIDEQLVEIEKQIADFNIELDKLGSKHTETLTIYNALRSGIDDIERKTSEAYTKYRSYQQEITAAKTTMLDLNSKLTKIKKAESETLSQIDNTIHYTPYDYGITEIEKMKEQLFRTQSLLMEKKINYKHLMATLETQNIPLPDDAVCKHCKQPITKEHRAICKQDIAEEITATKQELTSLKSIIEVLMSDEKKHQKILKHAEINFDNATKSTQLISTKEKELTSIRTMLTEYETLSSKEHARMEEKMVALEVERKFLADNNAKEIVRMKAEYAEKEKLLTNFKKAIEDTETIGNELRNKKAVAEDRKAARVKDIEKLNHLNNTVKELERKYHTHQLVVQSFSSYGIPAMITHTILDDFQIETNNLLTQLKPGLQTQFLIVKDRSDGDKEDTLDIKYSLNGHELEYAQLSGAQKLIASLCLKLGLASVIKKRLGVDIKLLLIDEVDQSLDDAHLDDFGEAIKKLQSEYKIMIITHNKELKDKFSTAIVVEQDENMISKASVQNAW
jgi:DNA repair exonuclease SbcCD ATPase subunit